VLFSRGRLVVEEAMLGLGMLGLIEREGANPLVGAGVEFVLESGVMLQYDDDPELAETLLSMLTPA